MKPARREQGNLESAMKYKIEVSWSEEDLAYVAMVAELPGCTASGASESEAQAKVQHAIDAWLAAGRAMDKEREAVRGGSPKPVAAKGDAGPAKAKKSAKTGARRPSVQVKLQDAAVRQLNGAITSFFAAGDTVLVLTLVLAAGRIFARLLDKARAQGKASQPPEGLGLSRDDYLALLARSEGFFQSDDADRRQSFEQPELLIALAVADCGEIMGLSKEMAAFQIWYRAIHAGAFGPEPRLRPVMPLVATAPDLLPDWDQDLPHLPKRQKLALGRELLQPSVQPVQFSLLP